ncbi:unnamed protein product [Fraxinus pennsylvanica]|uniref:DUF4283 domain-containing protein n=1 Tax=Fraxinus pennsylvanica TaxID=56036 RepID=A0AAD1ZZP9_9LAMI|nr:unnamed protein product [Fraxinus pennsylvanica]
MYERLKLTVEEKQEVDVGEEDTLLSLEKSKQCIAFSVISDREVNRGALKNTMMKVWQVEGKAAIKEVGWNKFLIELKRADDKRRIMNGRPWSFDKQLICVQDCEEAISIKDILFNKEAFWVQCHDLPFAGMNQKTGHEIGARLGKVLSVNTDSSGVCMGEFLRVKVLINISKPISRGRFLNIGGIKHWIPFKYERLPKFCYHCGLIKHPVGRCEKKEEGLAIGNGFDQQYGAWLRASGKRQEGTHSPVGSPKAQGDRPESHRREKSGHTQQREAWEGNINCDADLTESGADSVPISKNINAEIKEVEEPKKDVILAADYVEGDLFSNNLNMEGTVGTQETGTRDEPSTHSLDFSQGSAKPNLQSSPHKLKFKKGLAQGKSWKPRARITPFKPTSQSAEGEETIVVPLKRKEIGAEKEVRKKHRKLIDEEPDLDMAEAAEQPCQSP